MYFWTVLTIVGFAVIDNICVLTPQVLHETGSDNASDSSFRDGKESGIEATSNAHVDETGEGDKVSSVIH